MKKQTTSYTAIFNYIDGITLPEDVVYSCSHSGDCEEDCRRCMELPEVKDELSKITPEQLRKELKEYGAWSDSDLQDPQLNLMRILWIAAGDIQAEIYESN